MGMDNKPAKMHVVVDQYQIRVMVYEIVDTKQYGLG